MLALDSPDGGRIHRLVPWPPARRWLLLEPSVPRARDLRSPPRTPDQNTVGRCPGNISRTNSAGKPGHVPNRWTDPRCSRVVGRGRTPPRRPIHPCASPICRGSERHARPRPKHPARSTRPRRGLRQADHGRWRSARRDPEHVRRRRPAPPRGATRPPRSSPTRGHRTPWRLRPPRQVAGPDRHPLGRDDRRGRWRRPRAEPGPTPGSHPGHERPPLPPSAGRRPTRSGRWPSLRPPVRHRPPRTLEVRDRPRRRRSGSSTRPNPSDPPAPVAAGGALRLRRGDADRNPIAIPRFLSVAGHHPDRDHGIHAARTPARHPGPGRSHTRTSPSPTLRSRRLRHLRRLFLLPRRHPSP